MSSAWSQLDQLLTCAICLDRYRNPKLLPCQHTFCMEPCLEGLIDYARRQIKCPECRAEHRIPYQGVQAFPTNVTLVRFLELHRDITGEEPEPPPSMMERCNVCSEKANLERCAHCEKKICTDCKEAHVDILRREINRINNQVRRGLHRLSDALTQTKKNAEKLQVNCTQVKDEIDDIVRRYSKDLKHTEERLKHDLELYTQTEIKSITKLKEDLDAEVSNITSNCELIDKYVKDNTEWTDVELLEYKEIFLKTLDFLRTFDTDNSDFSRRIKFQPRADPDVLHRNIAEFGELKINAPVVPVAQQSLAPPPSNALMRSQSDHRLAAQFARRQDNRSFADINQRLGGHTSDTEREGRPTSPLYGRNRRDTDSGYRRYSDRSRDYDYQDREYGRSRYNREENSTSGLSSSRWRENEDYGHRSRYGRDYEDPESETQHTRTVRFAEDTIQSQAKIFDIGDATKGPLSGVVRLMDSSKVMERLHQNEARQKLQEKQAQEQPPPQPPAPVSVPPVPQPPPRRPPSRQQSEDDIDRQKKANKQQATSSTASTPASTTPAQHSPEVPSRQALRRTTSTPKEEESKPCTTPERVQRVDSHQPDVDESTASPRVDTGSERSPEPPSRLRKQPSITERGSENGEQERSVPSTPSTNETSRSTSRCPRPTLGKASSLVGAGAGATKSPLDKKASLPVARKAEGNDSEEDDEEEEEDVPQVPRATQSSFFSRFRSNQQTPQRRLPDPEPRLLEGQDDESEEDDEDDEDDEEEEEEVQKPELKVTPKETEGTEESESETSSSSSSSSESESSSEEEDDEEEEPAKTVEENTARLPNVRRRRRSSEDSVNSKSSSTSTATSTCDSRSKKSESEKGKMKDNTKAIYEDNEEEDDENEEGYDDEVISDAVETTVVNNNTTVSERKRPLFTDAPTPQRYISNNQRSDDTDATDSGSSSTSTKYHSLSRNTTPIVSNGTAGRNDSVSSEGSSSGSSGSSNSSSGSNTRYSGGSCRRPPLARSRSSHEIGLGIDIKDDLDDESDEPPVPAYRSRADRMSEGNNSYARTRSRTQDETPATLSTSSNNSWAKYLRSKYGSSATGRVVPRSRSSHSLYQRSDSESSEDEGASGRDTAVSPGSYGFSNPRSTYLQKKRMMFKIGSRGTEPGNFTWPRGIAVGPDNNIVIADSSNHRVQVFDAIGKFLHEFGTYGSAEGEFDCLAGVAVNRIGQYIVSDRYNQRIQLFDPSGRFLRAFGCEGRTDGRFNYPWGITTDSLGFIYVCDKENHRIQVFQSDGTFVGKFGSIGSRPGQLEHPHYIAVSNTNRVIVSDSNNHRVQIFDVNGRSLSTFGSEGSGEGQFKFPRGVAVDDQGYIIVGDSGNNRVQIFHPDGTFLKAFGIWGGGDGEFKGIEGIAVTTGGSVLVCDRENHRIQVF